LADTRIGSSAGRIVGVRIVRRISEHPLTGQTVRYGIAGAFVMVVYLCLPLLFDDALHWPIQVAIPIAYVLAVSLQFALQRKFVFRHVAEFALPVRAQIVWYVAVGAIQYPTTALGTFALPKLFGISDRAAFVGTSLAFSVVFFLFIRGRVFHGTERAAPPEGLRTGSTEPALDASPQDAMQPVEAT
jgi:putative flippase GtrA